LLPSFNRSSFLPTCKLLRLIIKLVAIWLGTAEDAGGRLLCTGAVEREEERVRLGRRGVESSGIEEFRREEGGVEVGEVRPCWRRSDEEKGC